MNLVRGLAIAASLAMLSVASNAETSSKQFALEAKSGFAAFWCSMFANAAKDDGEEQRLFQYGYKALTDYLSALKSGHVAQEDIMSVVPIGVTGNLGGPSSDFMIGVIYHDAIQGASDELSKNDKELVFNAVAYKLKASNMFRTENCALIGN